MSRIYVELELTAIETMPLAELRIAWTRRVKTTAPKVSAGLLRLALAHWVQSKAFVGVTKATERQLRELASGKSQSGPTAGTRLVRSWQGKTHIVTIMDDQRVHWIRLRATNDWPSIRAQAVRTAQRRDRLHIPRKTPELPRVCRVLFP